MSITHSAILDDNYLLIGISSFVGILLGLAVRMINEVKKEKKQKSSNPRKQYPRTYQGKVETLSKLNTNTPKFQSVFDKPEFKLSVVIPAYNEEKRLGFMLKDALKVLKSKVCSDPNFNCEVILVDDGSKDGTIAEYRRIASILDPSTRIVFKLIKLEVNSGKGTAVSEGFLASLGEKILFADADGSTDFEAVNKFEDIIDESEEDALICGSRCHLQNDSESVVKRSIFRLFFMKAFHLYLRIFGVKSVSDTQCGFKMLNRSAARKVVPWIHISGWIFDVEMILLAEWKGIRIHEIPVNWQEMDGTKLRIAFDSIKMAKDLLRIRLNYFLGIWRNK